MQTAVAENAEKVRENRLRRVAERRGLALQKCRRRDSRAIGYGGYRIIDSLKNNVVAGAHPRDYSFSLDAVEKWLTK